MEIKGELKRDIDFCITQEWDSFVNQIYKPFIEDSRSDVSRFYLIEFVLNDKH